MDAYADDYFSLARLILAAPWLLLHMAIVGIGLVGFLQTRAAGWLLILLSSFVFLFASFAELALAHYFPLDLGFIVGLVARLLGLSLLATGLGLLLSQMLKLKKA